MRNKFELLLPVGQKEMALAAIHNGADAIFVGFPGFNARGRSHDFEVEELKDIIETCHLFGVKVNLAFNIVIFETELDRVVDSLNKILPLKPDALIIQDLGLVQIVRKMAPDQPIHASTQMTITNDLAISLLSDLKIKRFVLGRENSLSEIKLIRTQTDKELEVFVHGALCVSYSGQCFTSETLGGRSANRGQCAQSCRFSYDLIVDGEVKQNLDRNYLVSPQDLCGIAEIPELMSIGVESFKIEGRLKTPDYVATAARSYRAVMDKTLNQHQVNREQIETYKREMAVQYSRGFFTGWLHGVDHQQLVNGTFSSHRGAQIGRVVDYAKDSLTIRLDSAVALENGDGLLWVLPSSQVQSNKNHNSKENREKGSFIFSVIKVNNTTVKVGISNQQSIDSSVINSIVYFNHNKELKKEIVKSYTDKNDLKRIPVTFFVDLQIDEKIKCTITDGEFIFTESSDARLQKAQTKSITEKFIQDELSALSATAFVLEQVKFNWIGSEKDLFITQKEIKILRQKLSDSLTQARKNHYINKLLPEQIIENSQPDLMIQSNNINAEFAKSSPKLNILLRSKEQVDDVLLYFKANANYKNHVDAIILDFEFGRDYSVSLEKLKGDGFKSALATTRILKPQEYQNLKNIKTLNPDVILVRNLGALHYFTNTNIFSGELRGDFSLNVTNHLTAEYLLAKGLKTVCVSYDVNAEQAAALIDNMQSQSIELTIHQTMPSFHMEHCVFAAFLSQGSSYKDCGKPCEKHKVQLKDQFGHYHWIKPDQECRNTMFNAKAQTALSYLPGWKQQNISAYRFEALDEHGRELTEKIDQYLKYMNKEQDLASTLRSLSAHESYGLSAGNLSRTQEYQSRKKEF